MMENMYLRSGSQKIKLPMTSLSRINRNSRLKMAAATRMEESKNSAVNSQQTGRRNILTGDLPEDFLRIDGLATGPPVVAAGPAMFASPFGMPAYYQKGGILSITLVQARLAKNYGIARMDPYCRLRVGNALFETPTDHNGAKNPRWNKLIQCPLPDGVNQVYIEIFDEFTFTVDERIAWGMITVKDEIFAGEVVDDWYSLSGKQGQDKEGMVNIIFQYREGPIPAAPGTYPQPVMMYQQPMMYSYPSVVTTTVMPPAQQPPGGPTTQPPQQPHGNISETDVKALKDMFPDMDEEVIKTILVTSGGNLDAALNMLLNMNKEQ